MKQPRSSEATPQPRTLKPAAIFSRWMKGRSRSRSSPELASLADTCTRAADGDLEARVVGFGACAGDFGRLCQAINRLLDVSDAYVRETGAAMAHANAGQFHRPILLRGMPGAYRHGAEIINDSALSMKQRAEQIQAAQAQRDRMVGEVAQSSQTVAAACEELTCTTSEISTRTTQATQLTERGVSDVDAATRLVTLQQQAASQIQSIVKLISEVAQQTNLLALNAAIEAALAGPAGLGFAVVADEVKKLAQSTSAAVGDIRTQVETLQQVSDSMTRAMGGINELVRQINATTAAVSVSVREQMTATNSIAQQINAITTSFQEIVPESGAAGEGRNRPGGRPAASPPRPVAA